MLRKKLIRLASAHISVQSALPVGAIWSTVQPVDSLSPLPCVPPTLQLATGTGQHWYVLSSFNAISSPWDQSGIAVNIGQTIAVSPTANHTAQLQIPMDPWMFQYDKLLDPGDQFTTIDSSGNLTGLNVNPDGSSAQINLFVSAGGSCVFPTYCTGFDEISVTVSANNPPGGGPIY